jgi:hypothetical protein
VPAGFPPSSVMSSSSAPNILKTKQSSTVVVTDGQVGVAEVPVSILLILIGVEVSWPVMRIMKP